MQKIKRILALAGALLLICMYGSTLIFALTGSSRSTSLLMASVAATIIVPVLLYAFTLVTRLLKDRNSGQEQEPGDRRNSVSDK